MVPSIPSVFFFHCRHGSCLPWYLDEMEGDKHSRSGVCRKHNLGILFPHGVGCILLVRIKLFIVNSSLSLRIASPDGVRLRAFHVWSSSGLGCTPLGSRGGFGASLWGNRSSSWEYLGISCSRRCNLHSLRFLRQIQTLQSCSARCSHCTVTSGRIFSRT